jgi:glycosyltransferase involved in cell wall biosynthesis
MKVTYTGPVRSSCYAYAQALYNVKALHAFVSGFSRLSPRAKLINVGDKLKRHDFFQTLYMGTLMMQFPIAIQGLLHRLASARLDAASYKYARDSDAFVYYRTQGYETTKRIHREGGRTLCIMEEVNSHAEYAREILQAEFARLGLDREYDDEIDFNERLLAYKEADYILCPSDFVVNSFIAKGFSADRLLKVNFGFPPIEVETTANKYKAGAPFRVLYVGQISYRKGLRYAIDAFNRLDYPNKEFIIVGPKTSVTGLEKTVIPADVKFTGVLKGEDLKKQYRQASCFILPSLEEGMALVQGEALSFGLPLLITTNTGGADLITDGVEGFVVEPGNADVLYDRLKQMVDNPAMMARMSAEAAATATRLGSWDVSAGKLVEQITKLIEAKKQ